jgi:ABC-type nitrate/sulfonate/bicarbonate transport system substrate-binding protein
LRGRLFEALDKPASASDPHITEQKVKPMPAKDLIKIVGFEKDVTLWVAETRGFLADSGIDITFDLTPNSTEEILGLVEGRWDIAFDNGDNVVGWDEGQGADGKVHDLFIFMGGAQELTQGLFTNSDIKEISALKGKTLGVDASATGFAVVLRHILLRHDLVFDCDYSLKEIGSSRMRLCELVAGNIAGAMLNPRYVAAAGPITLRQLAAGKDYADPFPARVGLATRQWADSHRPLLVKFIRSMIKAVDWTLNSNNKRKIIEIMQTRIERSAHQAEADYQRLFEPSAGLKTRCAFNSDSLRTILEMRLNLGMMKSPLPSFEKYYDSSFYREAISLINGC